MPRFTAPEDSGAKYSTARSKSKPSSRSGGNKVDAQSEYQKIKASFSAKGQLWEDPEFPAVDRSIFYSRSPPRPFEWKRPGVSIMPQFRKLFVRQVLIS